jgi:two-component system, chemotaxis family, CheB/CheR fusion protein
MESAANRFRVVCLCGSAGAMQAYLEILRGLRPDLGMAIIIVAHRGVENPDLLPELLSRATQMPVLEAQQGMLLKPNTVFLAPPNKHTTTTGSTFEVYAKPKPYGWPKSITAFLTSMAATLGARTVVIILSGMGSDGSDALAAVKASGGRVCAQSNAPYSSMPTKAFETGHVDLMITPGQIAAELRAVAAASVNAGAATTAG